LNLLSKNYWNNK